MTGTVGRQCFFELRCDADVIDNKSTRFVFEYPIYTGNCLSEICPPHGFVYIHCGQAGSIESRQPHVSDQDEMKPTVREPISTKTTVAPTTSANRRPQRRRGGGAEGGAGGPPEVADGGGDPWGGCDTTRA